MQHRHRHSTTSVNRVKALRRECFMSPRILSPTPHGPMDASRLSSSRPRLVQTCICADAGTLGAVACSPESIACSQWCALAWLDQHRHRAADINQPPPDLSPPSPSNLLRCTNAGTRPACCPSDTRPSLSDPSVHRPLSTHSLHVKKGMFQPI